MSAHNCYYLVVLHFLTPVFLFLFDVRGRGNVTRINDLSLLDLSFLGFVPGDNLFCSFHCFKTSGNLMVSVLRESLRSHFLLRSNYRKTYRLIIFLALRAMLMNIAISNEVTRSMVFNKFQTLFHAMRKFRGNAN